MATDRDDSGGAIVEYALLVLLVALVVAGLIRLGAPLKVVAFIQEVWCRLPVLSAPCGAPGDRGVTVQESLGSQRRLTRLECVAMADYFGGRRCNTPSDLEGLAPEDRARELYKLFSDASGELRELSCPAGDIGHLDPAHAEACEVLLAATGATVGHDTWAYTTERLRQGLDGLDHLPGVGAFLDYAEIAAGWTLDGEPMTRDRYWENVTSIIVDAIPVDRVPEHLPDPGRLPRPRR